ncbi:MAG: peptide deformylase [Polyangia bacterium]
MQDLTRRNFIAAAAAAGAAGLAGCAGRRPATPTGVPPTSEPARPEASFAEVSFEWTDEERPLVEAVRPGFDVVVRGCDDSTVLRRRAREVPPGLDLEEVAARMERTMNEEGGVGLAGPQVGLSLRVATLMLGYKTDRPETVFVRNPVILERSDDCVEGYEGCLSVPGVGGMVRRNRWIRVRHTAVDGEELVTEAEGYDAVLWQHELDHLDGVLYLDRLLGELLTMEEVHRRRKEREESGAGPGHAKEPPRIDTSEQTRLLDSPEGAAWLIGEVRQV